MLESIWVIPAVTFASFWLILFFGKRLPKHGAEIGIAALGIAFVLSCVAVVEWNARPADEVVEAGHETGALEEGHGGAEVDDEGHALGEVQTLALESAVEAEGGEGEHEAEPIRSAVERNLTWFSFGGVDVTVGTAVDGLTVVLLFTVALISLLVHVFSTNYMHGDVRFTYFFAALSLFTTGMLLLVVSSSLLQALFGWELMALCSFMLIGHWWEKKPNSDAAMKAFLTTRTGDIGLLVGIVIMFFAAGQTFDIAAINEAALSGAMAETALVAGAAALFIGVIGKSAQFPLHTWLPDAMAGPTPVSALIHAATMVVAGVYLVARLYGVFWEAFDIGAGGVNPIALIGGITILIAAALAFVQTDIKKVLAYSTVSQLGYMVMALGVGAWTAAIFHLFTHAFFKGLLFLGAGSVSHAVHSFEMKDDMGGLRKFMPVTYTTFMIGSLALAGLFPFAGFWSKDEILLGAAENGYRLFEVVGIVGAFMTAAYMTRCVYLTFFGRYRGHGHPHESPPAITVPLVVLAVFSVGAGFLNFPGFERFFELTENRVFLLAGVEHHSFEVFPAVVSSAVVLAGLAFGGMLFFARHLPRGVTARSGAARAGYSFLVNKYYLDHLYTGVVIGSIKGGIARAAYWINQKVIDGVVNGVGIASKRTGSWVYRHIDQQVVDGAVNGAGFGAEGFGGILRTIQTGRVQQYGALLFGASAVLALTLVIFI
ncbi:MAG: NADH-quinone oxidoreductase subunit L [Actinomycetota bacterium]|jgi:NADH-quinone oxidoreductase subunit L|nr:NADH-quinone oxidoreductase subunit L [Actinomycetota bacterium]